MDINHQNKNFNWLDHNQLITDNKKVIYIVEKHARRNVPMRH